MDRKVILLTGAPGVGKSTLRKGLEHEIPNLKCFDYGALLLQLKERQQNVLSYEEMRSQSSHVIGHGDVINVDEELIKSIASTRRNFHCLLDSHAVTRESYGYRAIPFSTDQLRELRLDAVIVLHAIPEILEARIKQDPKGRLLISPYVAMQHQFLQDAFAINYSVQCHARYYAINTDDGAASLLNMTLQILKKEGIC